MKRVLLLTLLALPLAAQVAVEAPKKTLPFTIEIGDAIPIQQAPPLQSFAAAQALGKWLFVSGRTTGLHTFKQTTPQNPVNNFPASQLNDRVWVIDPDRRQAWSAPLPEAVRPWLTMTNGQSEQSGDKLVITGGYGLWPGLPPTTPPRDSMRTFDTLTVIQVSEVIRAVILGKDFTPYITQVHDGRVRVTGGELRSLGDRFYLIFGQVFDGLYSPANSALGTMFTQTYNEQIASFKIDGGGKISEYKAVQAPIVSGTVPAVDARPYHRRDLTVSPVILDDGTEGLAAWGGVFVPGEINAYRKPVYINGSGIPTVDTYQQFMSQYNTAVVSLYSASTKTMHTTFFGGISLYYLFAPTGEIKRDNGLPFIRNVTTLSRTGGAASECVSANDLPGLYGAGAQFLPSGAVAKTGNGVLQLDTIKERTFVGYIYGGINATQAQTGAQGDRYSSASSNAYPVYVTPKASTCAAFMDATTKD